ncbi:MAG: hypothetical protein A2Z12_03740 [Actinobacteria bacterium RBG_16_68_21]|nr:MAG: hypothetical protein A2Z12_03740 [Actinobacteria bacterium RBG_16_68_21]
MPIDRDVIDAVLDMDEHDLRRLVILARARLEARGVTFDAPSPQVALRQQWVRCGKPNCGRCPHGPYWYAYWREDGRRRSRYVGKLEDELVNPVPQLAETAPEGGRGGNP